MNVGNVKQCTACGACVDICSLKCISFALNSMDEEYAIVDLNRCINCGRCTEVCPQINKSIGFLPNTCYAAWSLDGETRKNSASGGIAAELYRYECSVGGVVVGAAFNRDFSVSLRCTGDALILPSFQNSKYVHSDARGIYSEVAQHLKCGTPVTFIGLPCQVAGLNNYLSVLGIDASKLVTADLVCHGSAPPKYLQAHIRGLERKYKKRANTISFRDPRAHTHTYTFTLRDQTDDLFYQKKVYRNDCYQVGYHSGVIYRENCYSCPYACLTRQGDVTLADFSGLGTISSCEYTNRNVSCVLINTEKGEKRFRTLAECSRIFLEQRPIEEAVQTERQLREPTLFSSEGREFRNLYAATHDFGRSVKIAAKKRILKNQIHYYSHVDDLKRCARKIIPSHLWVAVRKTLRGK